jgi:hypothetical protein
MQPLVTSRRGVVTGAAGALAAGVVTTVTRAGVGATGALAVGVVTAAGVGAVVFLDLSVFILLSFIVLFGGFVPVQQTGFMLQNSEEFPLMVKDATLTIYFVQF